MNFHSAFNPSRLLLGTSILLSLTIAVSTHFISCRQFVTENQSDLATFLSLDNPDIRLAEYCDDAYLGQEMVNISKHKTPEDREKVTSMKGCLKDLHAPVEKLEFAVASGACFVLSLCIFIVVIMAWCARRAGSNQAGTDQFGNRMSAL